MTFIFFYYRIFVIDFKMFKKFYHIRLFVKNFSKYSFDLTGNLDYEPFVLFAFPSNDTSFILNIKLFAEKVSYQYLHQKEGKLISHSKVKNLFLSQIKAGELSSYTRRKQDCPFFFYHNQHYYCIHTENFWQSLRNYN